MIIIAITLGYNYGTRDHFKRVGDIHSLDHFIRSTCNPACKYLINLSCGWNSVHKSMQTWSRGSAIFQTKWQNGKEMWWQWLWLWNDCWCQTGWFDYLRNCWSNGIFHTHQSLVFVENGAKKEKKNPVSRSSVDKNTLLTILLGSDYVWLLYVWAKLTLNERGQRRRRRLLQQQ